MKLLDADEPAAFSVVRPDGRSPFLLTCDHASAYLPRRLNFLGLSAIDQQRHIAWDMGAAAVARRLAEQLDAFLILQNYSRLAIDCNRPLASPQSITRISEATVIAGNESVSAAEALARQEEIYHPYHGRIRTELDHRLATGRRTILIAMHSFTPVFHSSQRPWHAGLLYNRDRRLADALLPRLRAETGLVVGDNEPYAAGDATDFTIPEHGERRGIPHVGIEMRQDLIADAAGQQEWADRLAAALTYSAAVLAA